MLTPDEISQRRFLVSLRGYDRDEVTEFLGEVASEVRTLRARAAELEAQTQRVGASGVPADSRAALQSLGEETTRILVAAEESARSIETRATAHAREAIEAAEREARETTERASRQAARTIAEAERRRDEVAAEIAQLHQERDEFVSALRASMTTVAGVAGGLEHDPATPVVARDGAAGSHAAGTTPVVLAEELADAVTPTADEAAAQRATDEAAGEDGAADRAATDEAGDEDEDEEGEPAEPIPDVEPEPDQRVDQDEADADEAATDDLGPAAIATIVDAEAGTLGTVALLRDATLESIRDDMRRQCKRGLQEVHNEVLVAIRDHGRDAELVDLLPAETDLDDLGSLGTDHLAAAYRGALDDAASAVGGDTPGDLADGARVHAAAATFRAVLSHEVTAALRATLRAGLEATEAEPQLSERVSEVFRDLRGPVLEAVVEENLQRTYGHGLLDAWDQLDVGQVRWEPGAETRCPENRCHANADEGPVAIGHDFPSGDRVPPAHPGCTCVVVPA